MAKKEKPEHVPVFRSELQLKDDDIIPQIGMQEETLLSDANVTFIGGNRGGGKAQPYDADVLTPFGFKKMGLLKVGDQVMNPDGRGQYILQIHEQGVKDIYEIEFIDGAKCECTFDHLWQVRKTCGRQKVHSTSFFDNDPFFDGKVWTTEMIWNFMQKKDSAPDEKLINVQNLLTPLCKPIAFTKMLAKKSKLHPYLIGVLLGDGCITNRNSVSYSKPDSDVRDRLNELGYNVRVMSDGVTNKFGDKNFIADELEKFNLIGTYSATKFIPEYLKYASIEDRLELIRGLFDTDGYVDDRGHVSYSTSSPMLSEDVQWIIRSLGGKATVTTKIPTFIDGNGDKKEGQLTYTMFVTTMESSKLFYLPRKKDRCVDGFNGDVSELARRITGISKKGKKQCRCITVNSSNSLYITNDFIVTHNSYVLVLDPCYDISNGNFNAMMIRKETDQLKKGGGLYDKASKIYEHLGAKGTNLKFKFPSGAVITYEHIQNENPTEVDKRFKGLEIPAIYVDEIDQFMFNTFLKLLQSNRNSIGIRNRILGTCNPNKNSWLRKFLDWYISDSGTIDPLRDRQTRYFYVYGKTVNDIFWGDTKEIVYEQAKYYIDRLWNTKFEDSGLSKMDMIKSFKFIKGDLAENPILLRNDPSYIGSISMGGIEATARNIEGNWDTAEDGEEMVTSEEMAMMFDPFRTPATNGVKYLSVDVALLGLDNFVVTLYDGDHIEDVFVKEKLDSEEAKLFVKSIASEYGVREDNICYDNVGNGQVLTCLKQAFPINAMAAPIGTEIAYDNLKSQILYDWGRAIIEGKITCSQKAANRMFNYGSGSKKQKIKYSEILQTERRALKQADSSGKTKMLNKPAMKKILGGISPDFMESAAYKRVFNLNQKKKGKGFVGLEWL